ncbi:MAG: DUF1257 domain-containing protein [Merismopedia sp. SIO2A8]|nr:DUF1257 domain-containing protein [Merismopedia sp. SIO2A8]
MSHFTRIKVQIKDNNLLLQTLTELGYTVEQNVQVRGYRSNTTTSEYVIRCDNGYDVGFQKSSDGNYEVIANFQQAHLNIPQFIGAIQQKYAHNVLLQTVDEQGYTIEAEEVMEDGTVRVVLGRWV